MEPSSPPIIPSIPILGNLLEARRDPLGFLDRLAGYPAPVVGFKIGPYAGYLLQEPEDIRHVLQANHHNYSKDNLNYRALKPVLGDGLVTSDGELWRRQRRALQPAFQKRRLEQFGALTTTRTVEMLNRWELAADDGRALDIWAEITALTLTLIAEWLFGVDVLGRTERVKAAFDVLNSDVSYRLRNMYFLPRWIPTPRNRRFGSALNELDQIIREIIADMRAREVRAQGVLARYVTSDARGERATGPDQLRDEAMTLLLAGHETTAALLTWSLHLLSTHPRVMMRLQAELDHSLGDHSPSTQDLPKLGYAKCVLEEVLRLYPPIWIMSRTAVGGDRINAYQIRPGTNLILSPYVAHRHSGYWQEPERFNPDRFCRESGTSRPKFAYFPFGGGPRLCIGRDLAMLEAQLILTAIVTRFALKPVNWQQIRPEPLVTLRPDPSPMMIPIDRRAGK